MRRVGIKITKCSKQPLQDLKLLNDGVQTLTKFFPQAPAMILLKDSKKSRKIEVNHHGQY